MLRKIFICFLILLLIVYPAYAADVSLNRWVLNVTLHDDGLVEEVIQAEFNNTGSLPLDGFSFTLPVSEVTIDSNQSTGVTVSAEGGMNFNAPDVKQQIVSGKTNIIVSFDKPIDAGKKWSGRIGFKVKNWAVKKDSNYSIDIPIEAPAAIVSGKSTGVSVPQDADIRSQVFLPESVEVISVTPKPFRILFQNDLMVPTWSPDKLHIGDTISIKSSYSSVLNKIVETDKKWRELKARIDKTEKEGINVSVARSHLKFAEDYNTNQALQSYFKNDQATALEFNGYANNELRLAEEELSSGNVKVTPGATESKKNPGFEASILVLILLITLVLRKKK